MAQAQGGTDLGQANQAQKLQPQTLNQDTKTTKTKTQAF
jgi:hypothetical protein